MKILIVCKSIPIRSQGGIQTHVWKLSENLIQLGHEVSILTAGSWKKGVQKYNIENRSIIEIPYLPLFRQPFMPMLLEELSFNISAKNWLKKHETAFDIIHLQGRSGFLFTSEKHKKPLISTFHGLVQVENERAMRTRTWELKLHEKWASWYEKKQVQNSDAIIAVSQEMLSEINAISEKCLSQVTVISNGVECDKDILPSTEFTGGKIEGNFLVFVGRIDRIKGIYNLVQAMKKVKSTIKLVMIGDSFELQAFEKHVSTEGVADRIILTGALPNKDVLAWINRSYALILPSFHETQGIVLLEANACGKPVLASKVGGITEVVEHGKNGFLFNPHDIDDIVNNIHNIFDMPEKAQEMGNYGRFLVKTKYTWDRIAHQTVNLYEETINQFALQNTPQKHIEEKLSVSLT